MVKEETKEQLITFGYVVGGFAFVLFVGAFLDAVVGDSAWDYISGVDPMVAYFVYLLAVAHFRNSWITAAVAVLGGFSVIGGAEELPLNPVPIIGLSIFMLACFWYIHSNIESDDWMPTEVAEKSDNGWLLVYQSSKDGEDRRWAALKKEQGITYCVDDDGDVREGSFFFDDRQDALQAVKKYSDPLSETEIKEDKRKKAKRWGSTALWWGKLGGGLLGGIMIGLFLLGAGAEFLDEDPSPRVVSLDNPAQSTYEVTVQNSGGSGVVEVKLYWIPENHSYPNANYPENPEQAGFELHSTRVVQFNQGERRSVEFTGEMPEWSGSYYFRVRHPDESE